jgi:hypothetical protein
MLDFEFSPIDRYSKILISGAISNSLDQFKITKLEGRPLYLPRRHEEVRPISDQEMHPAIREIHRIFKKKSEIREACLQQFKLSVRSPLNTLNSTFIKKLFKQRSTTMCNCFVLWP